MSEEKLKKTEFLKGDKVLWYVIIAISIFSIFPVYSASTNLQYIAGEGTTTKHLLKHAFFVGLGLLITRMVGVIKYEWIGKLCGIALGLMIPVLAYTAFAGKNIAGASASRWITIGGISFQPSTFAYLMLIVYLCRYLAKILPKKTQLSFTNHLSIFIPILLVFVLVGKDNGSTALMMLIMSIVVLIVGQYPFKYIAIFGALSTMLAGIFLVLALNTNIFQNTRVHTWISRIETFIGTENKEDEAFKAKNYQVNQAKAAIFHGGTVGVGPGKSALKQSLPQSASDFIFAIIVEEYGLLGAVFLMAAYFIILIRMVIIATKIPTFYGSLLVLSIGMMIFFQLAVNISVAVNLIPVTGQTLPLISYGGSAMLVTYLQLGIVLNVSSRIQVSREEGLGEKQIAKEMEDIA